MEIGYLNQATLFDVSSNELTGPIPQSFACLAKMELLNLANNQFYGAVPESVCQLPNLGRFTLAKNYFTQVGPACRKLIRRGILDIKVNCILDLPNQRTQADCANFFSKPRTCPNERSLTIIPCKTRSSSTTSNEKKSDDPQAQASAPLSYQTLVPHRRWSIFMLLLLGFACFTGLSKIRHALSHVLCGIIVASSTKNVFLYILHAQKWFAK